MILVTGASGNVGAALLGELAGRPVRALYRDPRRAGPGAVIADFADPSSLAAAFEGVEAVFLMAATGPEQTRLELNVLAAAVESGARVVKLSVWRAPEELSPIARLHHPVETALRESGLPWTILRPNFYLQNFLRQPIRTAGVFSTPLITAPISFVDTADVARVAAHVLTTPGHESRIYDVTGPEAVTYDEAAERFSDVLGRPVRYVGLPDDEAREAMLARGMPEFHVDALIEVARAYREGGAEKVTRSVPDLTGRPATSVTDFARAHREEFS